ncbi:MAG: ZIP family metal transporter [Bacteroidales bacterium]|nr:ZIP family metal transporter [Bacteroidales bacterium]
MDGGIGGIALGLLIPFAGTVLGSAFVFFMKKEMPEKLQKALLGFASGVMVAASVWSLLIPAMEMGDGKMSVVPATVGLLAGFAFLLLIDYITPHLHLDGDQEGPESHLSKTTMLSLAVTIHNLPEGMAVGVAIAGALSSDVGMSVAGALALSLGIAIQNIPEGAIISMPLRAVGNTRLRSFGIGSLSGIVEPVGGLLVLLLASVVTPMMPYLLAFAAGAMLYVVIEELIPEASTGKHSNISTVGFAVGFALMMVLDVVLG